MNDFLLEIVCEPNPNAAGNTAIPEPTAAGLISNAAVRARGSDASEAAEIAAVEMVSRDRAPVDPGTTVGGSNAQEVCGGRLPLAHESVTSLLYGPPCGVTVTTCVLVPPAAMLMAGGDTSTA